jgi:molybdenum cofactor cytidylyltransferase
VPERIRGILLCGGSATRFGSEKLLAALRGAPLVSHSAASLVSGAGNALAVIPMGAAALRRVLEEAGCDILESADTRRGLGASLAAAVAASPGSSGWIVALGDMPIIRAATIASVREKLEGGALVAAPVLAQTGVRGHPVGFARALQAELATLDGDEGARALVERHRAGLATVEVDDPGIVADIDTPADLEKLR